MVLKHKKNQPPTSKKKWGRFLVLSIKNVHERVRILVSLLISKLFIDTKNSIFYLTKFEVQSQARKISQRSFNPQKVSMWLHGVHKFFHYSAIASCITFHIWKSVDCYISNKVYKDIFYKEFLCTYKNLKMSLYTFFEK